MYKIEKIIKRIGRQTLRQIFTLIVLLHRDEVPMAVKLSIIGVLGYLICPIDVWPDILLGGLLDDIAAITILLTEIAIYRNDEVEAEVDKIMKSFCR
jgi:uncharacterized membrane protein YkvA (DUF1232 family)